MKKLRIGLSLLAVLIGAGTVLASNASSVRSGDPTYNWITYDRSGSQTGTYSNKTQVQMEQITGCVTSTANICARAFDSGGNEVVLADLYYQ